MKSINHQEEAVTLHNTTLLTVYHNEVHTALGEILDYWMHNTHDPVHGGFVGRIDENNVPDISAPKGAVLNARILWSFSAAYKKTNKPDHLHLARIAFNYFVSNFIDKEYGGVYWSLTAQGKPLETKKQIYALAFAIYGCSAYFEISNNERAKSVAQDLFRQIETHSFDAANTGYLEAFTREWKPLEDQRLSDKDVNAKKTMNTHLHILEAYTALYRIWPDNKLKTQIKNLLKNFKDHFVDPDTGHLVLFFDEYWNGKPGIISYGHDIEAAWLLPEAAEAVNAPSLIIDVNKLSVKLAVATKGLDVDGALWYEYDPANQHVVKEKHWWVQAEAMVGFFNHWQLTKDESYLHRSIESWQFIREFIQDKTHGEWHWGISGDGTAMKGQDKVGFWKCPYHNTRACLEIIKRIETIGNYDSQ
ncbi:MAG: AGE family epimerase/isomerase [Ferruginibacter sp.]